MELSKVFERIVALGAAVEVRKVGETDTHVVQQVVAGGQGALVAVPRVVERRHKMDSLGSLVAWIREECGRGVPAGPVPVAVMGAQGVALFPGGEATELESPRCVVWVGPAEVVADAAYEEARVVRASLGLGLSEGYGALEGLAAAAKGVSQKALWRALMTSLRSGVSEKLLVQVSQVGLATRAEQAVEIDASGLVSGGGSASTSVKFAGKDGAGKADLQLDWVYRGQLWEGVPEVVVEQAFRLELAQGEEGLRFLVHLVEPREVRRGALAALEGVVRGLLEGAPVEVYVGRSA